MKDFFAEHDRLQRNLADPFQTGTDQRLTRETGTIFEIGGQTDVLGGNRENSTGGAQHPAGDLHRLQETTGLLGQCGQDQIAQVVAGKLAITVVAMLEQPRQQILVLGQGDETVAHVAGRRKATTTAQAARTAAIVAHRNDTGQVDHLTSGHKAP